jgi:hypothetical protein
VANTLSLFRQGAIGFIDWLEESAVDLAAKVLEAVLAQAVSA